MNDNQRIASTAMVAKSVCDALGLDASRTIKIEIHIEPRDIVRVIAHQAVSIEGVEKVIELTRGNLFEKSLYPDGGSGFSMSPLYARPIVSKKKNRK